MLKEADPVVPTQWGPSGPLTVPPATGEEVTAPDTVYICPMHPEVKEDKPGNCPKCGMKLQAAKKSGTTAAPKEAPRATPAGSAPRAAGTQYLCPMDKDVHETRPGKCPKCGMDLVAAAPAKATYYCPMHPEVEANQPGKCPKCEMDLVPKPKGGTR
jgi:hypothetical protein